MTIVRDVVIRFIGDDGKLRKANATLDATNQKILASGAASQKVATQSNQAFGSMRSSLANLASQIGITFSVAALIQFGRQALQSFREAEEAARKLSFAVKNLANGSTGDIDKLLEQSDKLQKQGIFSDEQIQKAQTALITIGLTVEQVEKLTPQIADLAAVTGEFEGSLDKVIAAINGQKGALKELGIVMKDTGSKTENINILTEKLGRFQGSLADALNTSAGAAANLNNRFDDLLKKFGKLQSRDVSIFKATILDFLGLGDGELEKLFISQFSGTLINGIKKAFDLATAEGKADAVKAIDVMLNTIKGKRDFLVLDSKVPEADTDALPDNLAEQKALLQQFNDLVAFKKALNAKGITSIVDDFTKVPSDSDQKGKEEKTKKQMQDMADRLRDVRIDIIADEEERDTARLALELKRELESIEGDSEVANQLRLALQEKFQFDLDELTTKFAEERAETMQMELDEILKAEEEQSQLLIEEEERRNNELLEISKAAAEASRELQQIQIDAFSEGFGVLSQLFRNNAELSKALLVFEKAAAIFEIFTNLGLEKSQYALAYSAQVRNASIAGTIAVVGPFLTAQLVAQNQAANLRAGLAVAGIAAQVIPDIAGLEEGAIDLKRGKHPAGVDTIPAMLNEGESVMTTGETKKHKGLLKAIRNDDFDRYINERYIVPHITMLGSRWLGAGAGMGKMEASIDEEKLGKVLRKNKGVYVQNIHELAKAMNQLNRKDNLFKRRGV